jgi:hypothetical protein
MVVAVLILLVPIATGGMQCPDCLQSTMSSAPLCLAVLATALIIGQMLASRLRDPQPPAPHGLAVSGLYRPPRARPVAPQPCR